MPGTGTANVSSVPYVVAKALDPRPKGLWEALRPQRRRIMRYARRHRYVPLVGIAAKRSDRPREDPRRPYPRATVRLADGIEAGAGSVRTPGERRFYAYFATTRPGDYVDLTNLTRIANAAYQFGLPLNQYRYITLYLGGTFGGDGRMRGREEMTLILPLGQTQWLITDYYNGAHYWLDTTHTVLTVGQTLFEQQDARRPSTISGIVVFDVGMQLQRYAKDEYPIPFGAPDIEKPILDAILAGATPAPVRPFAQLIADRREAISAAQAAEIAAERERQSQEYQEWVRERPHREAQARERERSAAHFRALVRVLQTTGRMSDIPKFLKDPEWYDRERRQQRQRWSD